MAFKNIEAILWNYIEQQMLSGKTVSDRDQFLLDKTIVDSMQYLRMIFFLEEEFKITIAESEMSRDEFDSVPKIAAFIRSKLKDHT